MKLNPKQQRFCEEYLIDLNATQAAIRAGYSKKTARTIASKLLTNIDIEGYIVTLRAEIQAKTGITVENTVNFIKEVSEEAREVADFSNALKGQDMLMKYLGGYEKKETEDEDQTINIHYTILESNG